MPEIPCYRGRFAPSPTGPLHLGSLYTALASFLDAKAHQGQWLLRIDDLDTPRNVPGATDSILKTLESLALFWDEEVYYQSQHVQDYEMYLAKLQQQGIIYPCLCSRKSLVGLKAEDYPNLCRQRQFPCTQPYALRIKLHEQTIGFQDRLHGMVRQAFNERQGDFILKRKDQVIAYQFAVVIDDYLQGVEHIVRGNDLLQETSKQLFLQQALNLPAPSYMHVPVLVDPQGFKLSKQTKAEAVDLSKPVHTLFNLLKLLRQQPPIVLQNANIYELLSWAIAHWNPESLKNVAALSSDF